MSFNNQSEISIIPEFRGCRGDEMLPTAGKKRDVVPRLDTRFQPAHRQVLVGHTG